jgi:RNA polymerase sigma factor (TIGR02999 family)
MRKTAPKRVIASARLASRRLDRGAPPAQAAFLSDDAGCLGMSEITELLQQARAGQGAALGQVFDRLYEELRRIARGHLASGERTLSPTVLVHEAYLRLLGNSELALNDRRHFLACAARAMRAIFVDHVRRGTALKRGGSTPDVPLDAADAVAVELPAGEDLLMLDQALDRLDALSPRQREVVELRWFAGLEFAEIASLLECSERTAKREWERARAFLHVMLRDA